MTYEYEGKTEKEAIEMAANDLGVEQNLFDVEIIETQKNSFFKKGYVKIRVHLDDNANVQMNRGNQADSAGKKRASASSMPSMPSSSSSSMLTNPVPQDENEKKVIAFVSEVISKMGYESTVEIIFREQNKLGLKLISPSSSILIGKKGKNLDALQLITNIYASAFFKGDMRIVIDSENYRVRREEFLVRLAYTTADSVRTSGGSVLLEPMKPFERRIIHTTLNDIGDVETKSEGEGLYKQVRVMYKRFGG
ncbi:MAG: protein jag [Treponemataceae bacterium]|nr:MAG: protein jag [Treponemataceae bacterium]